MKKKILTVLTLSVLATGCATNTEMPKIQNGEDPIIHNNDTVVIDESGFITDEVGFITDEVAIINVSPEDYIQEVDQVLTEDGFTMRIDQAEEIDKVLATADNIIYFSFDSDEINEKMKETILNQLNFLKKYPKIKVILEGHTDEIGANSYNLVLGEKRALAVKKILVESGLSEKQIEVISYGEMRPVATGATKSDNAKNRRAVFIYK